MEVIAPLHTSLTNSIGKKREFIKGEFMNVLDELDNDPNAINLFIEKIGEENMQAQDFDESKVKRDSDGKFSSTGGG